MPTVPTTRSRPAVPAEYLLLAASLWFAATGNGALWAVLGEGRGALPLAAVALAVVALQFAMLGLLAVGRALKPVLGLLLLASAVISFFTARYGVLINREMLVNALNTDSAEVAELLTWPLVAHVVLYAGVPLLILGWLRVPVHGPWRGLARRGLAIVTALAVAGAILYVNLDTLVPMVRSHREVRYLVTPANLVTGGLRLARETWRERTAAPRVQVGLDAHRVAAAGRKPQLLVLVVGESLRAANFGLSGYGRNTTPQLAALGVTTLPRVTACGASTEVSLPCMFAPVGLRDYDKARIRREENLLDVLKHAGFSVTWIDNQSGCKGVCVGIELEQITRQDDPALCNERRCLDGILLDRLESRLPRLRGDSIVVLHMHGSHGPTYSERYPPEFARFTPVCERPQLDLCSRSEIRNAYDNSVLYTDAVLARAIGLLQQQATHEAALLFVPDHGESLGEDGMYLHGLPNALAPREQREVPMVIWQSPGFAQTSGVAPGCLAEAARRPVTHDHLFHTVLGLLNVTTAVRDPSLDLAGRCRQPRGSGRPYASIGVWSGAST